MAASQSSTINLGLPSTPETSDAKLFYELVKVYNAINLLAYGLDTYTADGSLNTTVTTTLSAVNLQLIQANQLIDSFIDNSSEFTELKKNGKFGTLVATGAFGCNSKTAQTAVVLPANATDLATAITLVNAIKVALIANGIGA